MAEKHPDSLREKLIDLYHAGYTYGEIALQLNMTRSAVAGMVGRHRLNLPDPQRSQARKAAWARSKEARA